MYLNVNKVIDSKVGTLDFSSLNSLFYWVIDAIISNTINSYLKEGININKFLQEDLGIFFIQMNELQIYEDDSLFMVKLTPGWNFTNETIQSVFNNQDMQVFDLSRLGLGSFIDEASKHNKGIEKYLSERLERALDL